MNICLQKTYAFPIIDLARTMQATREPFLTSLHVQDLLLFSILIAAS
jgi:hypothetical protein